MQKELGNSGHSPRSLFLMLRWLIGAHGHVDGSEPLRGTHSEGMQKAELLVVLLVLHIELRPRGVKSSQERP